MFCHVDHSVELIDLECETLPTGRTYKTPQGKKYPSVTTVLGIQSKAGLEAWKKRVGEAEAQKISTQAATRGTAIHTLAEDYLNNKPDWNAKAMPANIFSFNQIKPILDKRIDNIWFQEAPLYSDYLQTAGRVDCIAEFDGKLSIIDFKTSRKAKKREWIKGYFMQESFYAVAFEERVGKPIKQLVTIITVDGDEPQVFVEDRDDHIGDFMELRLDFKKLKGF
jgi:ATP-dependent exoDNAse (exonuclease V) beta subunit